MSDFFKNNPIALRHCLLYEFLRKNPVQQSFTELRMTIGPYIIKKEELQVWFDQFNQGRFDMEDGKKPIKDMRDVLQNDKYALRVCILYESLRFKTVERIYLNSRRWLNNLTIHKLRNNPSFLIYNYFCNVIGKDVMKYREFDFWFYRLFNGEFDLIYERDKDNKIYELMDMPIDIMKIIVEYLDIFDRANLVRTSRSLQTFAEDQKLFHHTLKLTVSNGMIILSLSKSVNIKYIWNYGDCKKIFKNSTNVQCYRKQALLDLKNFLENPKLHLDTLNIELNDNSKNVFDCLEDALEFTHSSNVKNLILEEYSLDKLPKIIPSLKPGYLTTINIVSRNPNVDLMEEVFEMEQWKQAKYFKKGGACFIWPLRNLYHFKEFTCTLRQLSLEDIREMKKLLFKSSEFERCSLRVPDYTYKSFCKQEFGEALRENPHVYHYPIPNSTDYFEIKVGGWSLNIQRHKS